MRSHRFPRLRPAAPGVLLPRLAAAAAAGLLLAAAGLARAAEPPRYTAVDLGSVPGEVSLTGLNNAGDLIGGSSLGPFVLSGGSLTYLNVDGMKGGAPAALNNAGSIAGTAYHVNNTARGARWNLPGAGPSYQDLGALGKPDPHTFGGRALDINDAGLIVGYSWVPVSSPASGNVADHAVAWVNNTIADLHPAGALSSQALAVNSGGIIVGSARFPGAGMDVDTRAAVWRDGVMTNLGTLGGKSSQAVDVNDAGWIVGAASLPSGGLRPVLWRDGVAVDLGGLPGGASGTALSVNNAGDIFGVTGGRHFLYSGGTMYDFTTLLAPDSPVPYHQLREFTNLNDAGQLAATAVVDGRTRVYLFTPVNVPEPSAAGLAALSLTGALLRRRRCGEGGARVMAGVL